MSEPNTKLTVHYDDDDHELFMSYGLLNQLIRIVPDIDQIGSMYFDPDTTNKVLETVLSKRSKSGKIVEKVSVEDVDIDLENVRLILDWVGAHLTDFFIKGLESMSKTVGSRAKELETLVSSVSGSETSVSETDSSGPST